MKSFTYYSIYNHRTTLNDKRSLKFYIKIFYIEIITEDQLLHRIDYVLTPQKEIVYKFVQQAIQQIVFKQFVPTRYLINGLEKYKESMLNKKIIVLNNQKIICLIKRV
jgi:hypothetical protein